ncbi:MAG: LytR family transcriptional regulator [Candidatus Aquidulcis sp.]|nr:MAG: LytR family transcriptional regulator [Candidatus Aquidulcis sp.]
MANGGHPPSPQGGMVPVMSQPTETPRRSAFAAAVFSLLVPGFGHLYERRWRAALLFLTPPTLLLALVGGIVAADGLPGLVGLLITPFGLSAAGILNILLAVWRGVAAADAWRGAVRRESGLRAIGTSFAGLTLSLVAALSLHLILGGYVATASELVGGIFSSGTETPGTTPAPRWDGKERLNVLLVGIDQRGDSTTFNTDTLIVASVDPVNGTVTMFSIPRDTVDFPVPENAQQLYGATYGNKINSYYASASRHPDVFPDGPMPALREMLGNFYGMKIDYSLMVNFTGFQEIVDALDGVRITARNPVTDDSYPIGGGKYARIHVLAGVHAMDGAEALIFARSRHGSSDFDRAARQQQVISAIRAQSDMAAITRNLPSLAVALKDSLKSDFPQQDLPLLLDLIAQIDAGSIRSLVFTPPNYQTVGSDSRGYIITPDVAKIRAAVLQAFSAQPTKEEREADAIAREAARIWVLNGTGRKGEAGVLATALSRAGLDASAPTAITPAEIGLLKTRFIVFNGAEQRMPISLALLEKLLGMKATLIDDPTVTVDVEIITGADVPTITP